MSGLTPDERRRLDELAAKITSGIDTAARDVDTVLRELYDRRRRVEARRRAEHDAAVNDVTAMMLWEQVRTLPLDERAGFFLAEGGSDTGAVELVHRVNRFLQARIEYLEATADA